ncbi:efflux RND transporter periplasmic adaptor subunit [Shewanella fodinae]|uniref:Multidrug efflux system membrane fusion protein n=2 Tax=Shewanella TaxID=22 RepID=A0A4V6NM96_9GAMM|nr:efflux RND transporter periplasmic adaptor subunit [Shewanella fodinae]MBO1272303.1 efflux RND transporter periplasmic adaptor subunit [Shewanella sp. 4t3-1-2LB]TCN84279.1 multidrug efflux system membrane fusion protein [Shewanella fodinae]
MFQKIQKKWVWLGLSLVILVLVMILRQHPTSGKKQLAPVSVTVATVTHGQVPLYIETTGTVTASGTVVVRPQISATLLAIYFQEGQFVSTGELLATLDDRAIQAQLLTAKGNLQRDEALLQNAKKDLQRYQQLQLKGLVTQQQLDTQASEVKQYQGIVKADQGTLDNLQVQLSYTQIRAPISGIAGLRAVDIGNLLQPSDTNGIVTLTAVTPVDIKFALTETELNQLLPAMDNGKPTVLIYDRQNNLLDSGTVTAIDNQLDSFTGTVMAKARCNNRHQRLFPNQFVNVQIHIHTIDNSLLLPTRAIQHSKDGDYIFVLHSGLALQQFIHSDATVGELSSVEAIDRKGSGLSLGDLVVVDGADLLHDGVQAQVVISPNDTPTAVNR